MGEVGGKCGGGPLISNQVAALDAFDVPRPSWEHDMHDPWHLSSHLLTPGQVAALNAERCPTDAGYIRMCVSADIIDKIAALNVFDALAGLHSMCDPHSPCCPPPCWY